MNDAEWNKYIKEKAKRVICNIKDTTLQPIVKEKQIDKVDNFNASRKLKRKHTKRYN